MNKKIYLRLIAYILIWQIYLTFMSIYAPLGTDWLPWHYKGVYNFSEYLKLNGYFSSYGFSVWSFCEDCPLTYESNKNQNYLTRNLFSLLPYVLINNYFGIENLKNYGHLFDKVTILFSGILVAELLIRFSKKKITNKETLIKSTLCFTFFIINPWTYKMIIAFWVNIYFLMFFLIGILMFINKKPNFGLISFFIAGCFDYQSSAGIAFYYAIFLILLFYKKQKKLTNRYLPILNDKKILDYKIIFSLALPFFLHFLNVLIASNELEIINGTSLITRIGISGDDIYNGGILGSLQFLAGNRISQCFIDFDLNINLMDMSESISLYNCILSLLSMLLISLISIFGLFILYKKNNVFYKIVILPITFLFLSYTFVLQQSSSVHLMGYSYFFSVLFSLGITSFIYKILERYNFSATSIIVAVPSTLGIILLCIRVSMLTGINS